jgi:hypothetical protein
MGPKTDGQFSWKWSWAPWLNFSNWSRPWPKIEWYRWYFQEITVRTRGPNVKSQFSWKQLCRSDGYHCHSVSSKRWSAMLQSFFLQGNVKFSHIWESIYGVFALISLFCVSNLYHIIVVFSSLFRMIFWKFLLNPSVQVHTRDSHSDQNCFCESK